MKPSSFSPGTRRQFLTEMGQGVLVASVGLGVARNLGLAPAWAGDSTDVLTFGSLEPLVCLMQETPADDLLPLLAARLRSGTELRQVVAAGALANARTFGGQDYIGFHTLMALGPAFHMAQELPSAAQALPVLKVLYRNTRRIQEQGGRKAEVLHPVQPSPLAEGAVGGELLREAVRQKNLERAEQTFTALAQGTPEKALDPLLYAVQDNTEVHRVVLPYRAWDLMGIIGREQAHTLLRQSVRYCVQAESWTRPAAYDEPRTLLPRLLEEYRLLARTRGDRDPGDAWVAQFSETLFRSTGVQAAEAAASALAEGLLPEALGEAISLAANQLVLRDHGRSPHEESPGKPVGSVHGDSIGVHASDSANAWRNLARLGSDRNCFASLILGAYQVALDRTNRGGDFAHWDPLPITRHVQELRSVDSKDLLGALDEAVRGNLQARAGAIVHRCGELDLPEGPIFEVLLRYAISEDGSLHGEKYYRTVREEFAATRRAFRWRHLIGLARVTASEYGRPAAGIEQARRLLGLA